jgi:hypothetical protein
MTLWSGARGWKQARVGATHFGAGFLGCEHPFDAGSRGIALPFPGGDFGCEALVDGDAPVQALAAQHANLDLDHVEPAGVLGNVVELQSAPDVTRLCRGEGLIERAGEVCRQIVEDDLDALCLGKGRADIVAKVF